MSPKSDIVIESQTWQMLQNTPRSESTVDNDTESQLKWDVLWADSVAQWLEH